MTGGGGGAKQQTQKFCVKGTKMTESETERLIKVESTHSKDPGQTAT